MNSSANSTTTNASRRVSPVSTSDEQNYDELFEGNSRLSPEAPVDQEVLEDMDIDEDVNNSSNVDIGHSEHVSNSSSLDEIKRLEENLRKYKVKHDQLIAERDVIMLDTVHVDMAEQTKAFEKMEILEKQASYLEKAIISATEMATSYKKDRLSSLALNKQLSSMNGNVQTSNSHLRIREKDLPVFDVKPSYKRKVSKSDDDNGYDDSYLNHGDKTLNAFLASFENVFKYSCVDIKKNWMFHLETCFQHDPIALNWYVHHIKNPIEISKKKISWEQAKVLMKNRFDVASTSFRERNEALCNIRQHKNETVMEYSDRFQHYLLATKHNPDDCYYFNICFLNSLFNGKQVKDKIEQILKDHELKKTIRSGGTSTSDSIYAHNDDEDYDNIPTSFIELSSILSKHKHVIDVVSSGDNKSNKNNSSSSPSSSSPSSSSFSGRTFCC